MPARNTSEERMPPRNGGCSPNGRLVMMVVSHEHARVAHARINAFLIRVAVRLKSVSARAAATLSRPLSLLAPLSAWLSLRARAPFLTVAINHK
jgi:hypothetical protein